MLNKLKKHQIFWDTALKLSGFYPRSGFKKLPKTINIELTNMCNLRCPVCPTHFAMTRERGFMDFELFKSIIDEFKNVNLKPGIIMIFAGEPLLHKNVDKFVEYAAKNGHSTFISTNATLLSKDLSIRLIRAGLSSVHLCLEGMTKESHEAYRVGSQFELVKKNIEDFMSAKKELNQNKPSVTIQTLLTSFSENEIDKLIEWAKNIGANKINLKTLSLGSYTTKEMKEKYSYLLPNKNEFRRKISTINKTLCAMPLRDAVVYWNGELGLCCVAFNKAAALPNIKEKGFIKTFLSEEVIGMRKLGFQKKFDLCRRCSIGNADFMGRNITLWKD